MVAAVCKGTFRLEPGSCGLAEEQVPIHARDLHYGDDPSQSLYAPCDLVPFKPRVDVLLVGQAYAPAGAAAAALRVRLRVGTIDKAIDVFGERAWTPDGRLFQGARFARLFLGYERAAGGPGTANPVGVSPEAEPDLRGLVPVPNLLPSGMSLSSRSQQIPPVGFGPIAPSWPARRARLGRHAALWSEPGCYDRSLPEDLDAGYFNAAPPDQQLAELRSNEALALTHLHPEHPELGTRLPGLHPRAFVERPGAALQALPMCADTLWIDTDRALCAVTWRAALPVEGPQPAGRILIAIEELGRQVTAADVQGLLASRARPADASAPVPPAIAGEPPPAARRAIPRQPAGGAPADVGATAAVDPSAVVRPAAPFPVAAGRPASRAVPGDAATPFRQEAPAQPRAAAEQRPADSPWASGARLPTAPLAVTGGLGAGVVASADAAIAASAGSAEVQAEPESGPALEPSAPCRKEAIELVWFDPAAAARVRKCAAWQEIIDGIENRPADMELDAVDPAADPAAVEARREIFELLACGTPLAPDWLPGAAQSGVRADGKFVSPLVLARGEIELGLDVRQALEITVALTEARAAGGAEDLPPVLAEARALLAAGCVPESLAAALLRRLDKAAGAGPERPEAAHASLRQELLLQRRAFARREVLGESHLRALLRSPGTAGGVPVYLPEAATKRLPLLGCFAARLLAELHPRQEDGEAEPHALRALALARVVTVGPGG